MIVAVTIPSSVCGKEEQLCSEPERRATAAILLQGGFKYDNIFCHCRTHWLNDPEAGKGFDDNDADATIDGVDRWHPAGTAVHQLYSVYVIEHVI